MSLNLACSPRQFEQLEGRLARALDHGRQFFERFDGTPVAPA